MVGYFMGCCQWYDSYLYDSYESVDRIFLKYYLVSARELSSLVGKIISAGAVFGNISRIMTRYCSISVDSSHEWDSRFHLDQYCVRELNFWEENLNLNLKSVVDCPSKISNYLVYSDASLTGCGAYLDVNGEQLLSYVMGCRRLW